MSTASDAPSPSTADLLGTTTDGLTTEKKNERLAEPIRFGLRSQVVVPIIAIASGIASALSTQSPTGNSAIDMVLSFCFGALIVWIGHRAPGQALVLSAVLGLFFTGLQLPGLLIGLCAVAAALFLTAFRRLDAESWAIGAAVCTSFLSQVVLNLPSIRFVGSASILAALAVTPVLIGGFRKLPNPLRRQVGLATLGVLVFAIVASVLAVVAALGAREDIEVGIEQAQDGVDALQDADQPSALSLLEASQANFRRSASRLGGPLTWAARLVPITAQHSRALETAADQGAALAATAARTAVQADVERIRGRNGQIDLDLVAAVNVELSIANRTLSEAQRSLFEVRSPWLLPQLSDRLVEVQEELATTARDIDLANHATSVMPRVLGSEAKRRYIVLFVQPAESREFGGFVGAYGLIEIDQGRFQLVESGGIDVDFGSGSATFTNPDDFPEPFIRVGPQINPQNLTATSDLQTIADAVRDLGPQWREDPDFAIDGVITLDPYALAGLLELTGPLDIEGRSEPVDANNVVDFLLRDQYVDFQVDRETRQDALRELAGEAFTRLFTVDIPGPERLGAIFGPAARANRLAMTTFDEQENAFFERVFLSANFPRVGSAVDMVGIYAQTGTASKLDGYAVRSTTYEVVIDPETGQVESQLTIVERNDAPEGASAFVLGKPGQTGAQGDPLVPGTNYLATGLYTRSEVEAISATTPFKTLDVMTAFDYDRHTVLFEVPQGGEAEVTIEMTSQVEPGRYDVFIPAQATANVGNFTLIVRPTAGWRVQGEAVESNGSWSQTFDSDEARGFSFSFEPSN